MTHVETDEYSFLTFSKFYTIITTIETRWLNCPAIIKTVANGEYYAIPIAKETDGTTWLIAWSENIMEPFMLHEPENKQEKTATSFYVDIVTVKD